MNSNEGSRNMTKVSQKKQVCKKLDKTQDIKLEIR